MDQDTRLRTSPVDIDKLLNYATKLILIEIKNIKELTKRGKLDHDTAQDLVRYHTALADRRFNEIQRNIKDQKKLSDLTTEELLIMAKTEVERIEQRRQQTKEIDSGTTTRNTSDDSDFNEDEY